MIKYYIWLLARSMLYRLAAAEKAANNLIGGNQNEYTANDKRRK
jgi:hypothetical protein